MTTLWNAAVSEAIESCLRSDTNARLILSAAEARCEAEQFESEFGLNRIYRSQLTGASLVGLGVGAAQTGVRAIVELPTGTSITQAVAHLSDHIENAQYYSPGRLQLPLMIRVVVRQMDTFANELLAGNAPGLYVAVPSSANDARAMACAAFELTAPVLLLEPEELLDSQLADETKISELGHAVVRRAGSNLTIVAMGADVQHMLEAASIAASEGVEIEVIDVRCPAPLDLTTIRSSAAKTKRVLIIDRLSSQGGWSAELAVQLNHFKSPRRSGPVWRCRDFHSNPHALGTDDLMKIIRECAASDDVEGNHER